LYDDRENKNVGRRNGDEEEEEEEDEEEADASKKGIASY